MIDTSYPGVARVRRCHLNGVFVDLLLDYLYELKPHKAAYQTTYRGATDNCLAD